VLIGTKFRIFGLKRAYLGTLQTAYIVRCLLTELRKYSKVRHKFHRRAMLTTTDVTEKNCFNIHVITSKQLTNCSGTHEKINVFGRLTGPWKSTVTGHFSGPCHLYPAPLPSANSKRNKERVTEFLYQAVTLPTSDCSIFTENEGLIQIKLIIL